MCELSIEMNKSTSLFIAKLLTRILRNFIDSLLNVLSSNMPILEIYYVVHIKNACILASLKKCLKIHFLNR